MYPGPNDPDLGAFVQGIERALADRGHEIERVVTEGRGGGKQRHLRLARDVRRAGKADVVYAHFLVPTGLSAALFGRAPLVVTAHGRDVRNIGAYPGIRAATRFVARRASSLIAVSDYLRRELEAKIPEARGKTEVVDCGVDLSLFQTGPVPGTGQGAERARFRLRRESHRAEERRPARRRLRHARRRAPRLRRRRPAPRRARRPAERRDHGPRPARGRAALPRRGDRPLPAVTHRAFRPGSPGGNGLGTIRRRNSRRRAAGVRAPGSRRPRRSPGHDGARGRDAESRSAATAESRGAGGRRGARRQASGGADRVDPGKSRSRSASLTSTSGRTFSSSPVSRASSSACS